MAILYVVCISVRIIFKIRIKGIELWDISNSAHQISENFKTILLGTDVNKAGTSYFKDTKRICSKISRKLTFRADGKANYRLNYFNIASFLYRLKSIPLFRNCNNICTMKTYLLTKNDGNPSSNMKSMDHETSTPPS